ncbi:MAG: ABC transporter permease [Ectothiorhodospiraceae bacterium]|nr:ABC transporter permease [Ectothiorhodospiraceae bacterium]
MSWQRFYAVFVARNREFIRDHAALAWNILFPVLIVAGFGFAFNGDAPNQFKVGVIGTDELRQATTSEPGFFSTRYIQFIPVTDTPEARRVALTKVERHQLDMLFELNNNHYWINRESGNGYILERVLNGSQSAPTSIYQRETVSGREIRYVDWLIPGVLGMNIMFSALFGVGYVIVRYRKNGVLKRLHATPLTAFEFLSAQVISRLWLIMAITIAVYVGADLFIGFTMHGSYATLLLVAVLGSISMISLGLAVAARIASEELAGGILNFVSWPMMFLSGVWFSLEGLHPAVQKLALTFPLTHVINAARSVMIDGASLWDIGPELITLSLMSLFFLALGSRYFRWQ